MMMSKDVRSRMQLIKDALDIVIQGNPDKAVLASEKASLQGWFIGKTMQMVNGSQPRGLVEIAVRSRLNK